jgi:hypothetical protein
MPAHEFNAEPADRESSYEKNVPAPLGVQHRLWNCTTSWSSENPIIILRAAGNLMFFLQAFKSILYHQFLLGQREQRCILLTTEWLTRRLCFSAKLTHLPLKTIILHVITIDNHRNIIVDFQELIFYVKSFTQMAEKCPSLKGQIIKISQGLEHCQKL